jgi:colanic acid/amylovoran biosynthesis protein
MPQSEPLHIGLFWHSATSGNLGVGALTLGNIAMLQDAATTCGTSLRLTIIGMVDGDCPVITAPDVTIRTLNMRRLLSPTGLASWLGDIDLVLDIGAGDSFAEIYGKKRFFFLAFSKWLAIRQGIPLILSPQTIGPFTRTPYRQVAGWLMNRAAAVVARDAQSHTVAHQLAPRANVIGSADVAFVLPFEDRSAERGERHGSRVRIGINVSGLLYHAAANGRNPFGLSIDYADYINRLLETLCARADIEVHLITHAISSRLVDDNDDAVADLMARRFASAVRVPSFAHPSAAKSYLSSLDFLVASRMHACIGAFSSGVPVLPVAYSRKFQGVFGQLGYDHEIPVASLTTDEALTRTVQAINDRKAIAAEVAEGKARVDSLLQPYRDLLARSLMREACQS